MPTIQQYSCIPSHVCPSHNSRQKKAFAVEVQTHLYTMYVKRALHAKHLISGTRVKFERKACT